MRDLVENRIEELEGEINSAQRREEVNRLTELKRELESLVAEHEQVLDNTPQTPHPPKGEGVLEEDTDEDLVGSDEEQ